MGVACRLKTDCTRWTAASTAELAEKYGVRVPRYTSYPTAPHFHAGIGEAIYRQWLRSIEPQRPISLYLHVPFCKELCWYCGCHTAVARRRAPIADYVDMLIAEIALVADAIGVRLPVASVHFGGGTPNSLSPDDLDRVFAVLRRSFAFAPDAEIAAEIDPRVLDRAWVESAARNGLTRASLGVQDVDPIVQKAINRHQPWAMTVSAVDAFRQAGIASINLDLMYGLPHQSCETIGRTIDQVLQLRPDRIALFGYAHVPWMKPHQQLIPEEALPDGGERFKEQAMAAEALERAGYVRIGLDHFARIEDPLAQALIRGSVHRNFQGYTTDDAETLLGFGASSIGRLPAGYVQNLAKVPQWRSAIVAGQLPVARGIALDADDRIRAAIIERLMCEFGVDLDALARSHAVTPNDFQPELDALEPLCADGLVVRQDYKILVTDRGRPFIRTVCAVFDRHLNADQQRHSRAV